MNEEVNFKGVCPVELFEDMYDLSKKGILKIEDFTFKKDHIDAIYYDMWATPSHQVINEFRVWFGMYINKNIDKLILYVGPGGGEYIVELDLNEDVLSFYNKWFIFKKNNPKYEDLKEIPKSEPLLEEEADRLMGQIECETCLFAEQCTGVFCLK